MAHPRLWKKRMYMLSNRFIVGWSASTGLAGGGLFAAGVGETTTGGLMLAGAVVGLLVLSWFGWRR